MMGVAIVTGAQRGMGKAIALALAEDGFDVAVVDLQVNDALNAVAVACKAKGVNAVALACDIAKIETHAGVLDAVEKELGAMTTLVNNAGVSVKARGDLLDVTPDSYDFCQDVNTRGTFFLTQAFARRVRDTVTPCHRSIITITSANAIAVSIARGEYCISKAGASMMSKLFAARLSDEDIGVYEIQPGLIDTEMVAPVRERYHGMTQNGGTVIKRLGTPEDVARIALTQAKGLLPYTVGQAIQADGGLLYTRY